MCSRGAGVPPGECLESGKQAKRPMFSAILHPAPCLEAAPPKSPRCMFRSFRATSGGSASCRAGGDWAAQRPHRLLSLVTIHLSLRPEGRAKSLADGLDPLPLIFSPCFPPRGVVDWPQSEAPPRKYRTEARGSRWEPFPKGNCAAGLEKRSTTLRRFYSSGSPSSTSLHSSLILATGSYGRV